MKYGRTILTVVAAAALLLAFTSQADADPIPPGLRLRIQERGNGNGQGPPEWLDPPGQHIAKQRFRFQDTFEGDIFNIVIDIEADPDPYVNVVFTITNVTTEVQDFDLSTVLPIDPVIVDASLTGGSVSFTLIDLNGDGATLSTIDDSTPIYMSQIDGEDFVALMPADDSWSVGSHATVGFGPDEFGPTPGDPTFPGPAVSDTIAINLNASLSPGDVAVVVATFVVIPDPSIPEPATMALLAFGGMGLLARRKRRHA